MPQEGLVALVKCAADKNMLYTFEVREPGHFGGSEAESARQGEFWFSSPYLGWT